jgi:hypothetical protein
MKNEDQPMEPLYDPQCENPNTPPEVLESLYWAYFTATSRTYHPGCIAIAKNPNISRSLLSRASLHTLAVATNPALAILQLEDPQWVKRNINPKALVLLKELQKENQCLN